MSNACTHHSQCAHAESPSVSIQRHPPPTASHSLDPTAALVARRARHMYNLVVVALCIHDVSTPRRR
eukprot:9308641-Pyramimonas_sp.AAC.1